MTLRNLLNKLCIKNVLKVMYQNDIKNLYLNRCAFSRGQDVIPWDLLAEIDFIVSSYSLTFG